VHKLDIIVKNFSLYIKRMLTNVSTHIRSSSVKLQRK